LSSGTSTGTVLTGAVRAGEVGSMVGSAAQHAHALGVCPDALACCDLRAELLVDRQGR
jgi:hypothetical protein